MRITVHSCHVLYFKRAHRVETQQIIELKTLALVLTWCANIFVGCTATPTFLGRSLRFLILSIILKKREKSVRGKF